jgi:hypothetical protein
MDPFTMIALIGLSIAAVGTGVSAYGSVQTANATKDAEMLRKKQMGLDAMRKRREILRESMMAKATALTNASAQGAQESSGLQGGYAQISGVASRGLTDVNQSEDIGKGIFDANAQAASGQAVSAIGGGVKDIGMTMAGNNDKIGRIFGV